VAAIKAEGLSISSCSMEALHCPLNTSFLSLVVVFDHWFLLRAQHVSNVHPPRPMILRCQTNSDIIDDAFFKWMLQLRLPMS
jgi:hypothetical protein